MIAHALYEQIVTWKIKFITKNISSMSLSKQSNTMIRIGSKVSQKRQAICSFTFKHKFISRPKVTDIRLFMITSCAR